jgi:uncharacterized protein YdbL (DUF1318 family)
MKKIIIIIGSIMLLISCSIFSPKAKIEINIVGEKTSLENQILGNYTFLGREKFIITSVRTIPDDISEISDSKKRSYLAYQNRIYNQDDYERFMDLKIIGENNNGYLEIINKEYLEENPGIEKFVLKLIKEENRDRKIIYERIIQITEGLTEKDINKVEKTFYKKFNKQAQSGWIYQTEEGEWEEIQ